MRRSSKSAGCMMEISADESGIQEPRRSQGVAKLSCKRCVFYREVTFKLNRTSDNLGVQGAYNEEKIDQSQQARCVMRN